MALLLETTTEASAEPCHGSSLSLRMCLQSIGSVMVYLWDYFFSSNGHEYNFVLYTACLLISRATVCAQGDCVQQTVFFVSRRRLTTVITLFILWIFILPSLMHCLSFSSVGHCHLFCCWFLFCSPYLLKYHAVTCSRSPLKCFTVDARQVRNGLYYVVRAYTTAIVVVYTS